MEERLVVKNFGPIKDVDIRIGKLTVLIGEQATGKSTLGKLLAVCRYFSYIADGPLSRNFEEGLSAWGLEDAHKNENTTIDYYCKHYSVHVYGVLGNSHSLDSGDKYGASLALMVDLVPKSEKFKHLLKDLGDLKPKSNPKSPSVWWQIPTSFLQNEVAQVLDNPFYLPAERGLQSIFSLGRNSIQNISDSLFNQFAELDQIARNFTDGLSIPPLDIEYKNQNGFGYFRKKGEEQYHKMQNAASGYQSTIPIVLLIEY